MNTYRPLSPYARAVFGEDDFDTDFTAVEEQDMVGNGHLEIVPRPYRVTSDNYAEGARGDVVELALPVEIEAALISGGHLEPVALSIVGETGPEVFVVPEPSVEEENDPPTEEEEEV